MANFPQQQDIDVLPKEGGDIRDALTRAFDGEATEGSPTGKSAPSEVVGDGGEGGSPASSPETESGGRSRDPAGRFARAGGKAVEVAAPAEGAPAPAAAPTDAAAAAGVEDPLAKAPASWKPEKAALWDAIPAEARPYIVEREKQLQEGFQRAAQVREVAEGILNEFTPYAGVLQQEGATPASAIRALLQTAYALRTAEPEYRKALFMQLAQQYGVDFNSGFNQDLARAQADAATLRLQQMEASAHQTRYQESQIGRLVTEFAATHEFFPEVRETMGKLMSAGVAPDLETAYQQATQLVPSVKTAMEARAVEQARQQQLATGRERAARATRGGNAPGAGAFTPDAPTRGGAGHVASIRDDIEAAWNRTDG